MDLHKLKSFIAASELNSFTEASKSVNLTQSAVSQHIKDLEEELGCNLINRKTRPIRITQKGVELMVVARQMLKLWNEFKSKGKEHEYTGTIVLGYIRSAVTDDLARALSSIRQKYPLVTIKLIDTEGITKLLAEQVSDGKLDAALGVAPIDLPKGTLWRPYSSEKFYVVAPVGYQGETDEALLSQGPYIRFKPHLLAETIMDHEIQRRGIEVNKIMELDDYESILVMVENNLGVGIVQEHYMTKERLKKLKWTPFGLPLLRREGGIIARVDNPNNPLVDLLWESLRSVQ